jgi:sulfatase maturation enzyme AslB (radical SAM superfamily)
VATSAPVQSLTNRQFSELADKLVRAGLIDVVVPGMEPLLRDETWAVIEAARSAGARSIGMTTNGTLLERKLSRILESGLTVINVSLDGPRQIHDEIRGRGVFDVVMNGVRRLRESTTLKLITNTTLNRLNMAEATKTARLAGDAGFDFAAFHPFERSAEIDNSLELDARHAADAYEALRESFMRGELGSVVLEAEASQWDVILELSQRGWFDDMQLVGDDTGFLFFAQRCGSRVLLVNLMVYPHHYIRTIRVADNGGISSCRSMARTGWAGIGDLRRTTLAALLTDPRIGRSLARIWVEFRRAANRATPGSVERFLDTVSSKAKSGCDATPVGVSSVF